MEKFLHLFTPVSQGLPENNEYYHNNSVIVITRMGEVKCLWILHDHHCWEDDNYQGYPIDYVTHWLDLSKLTTKDRAEMLAEKSFGAGSDYNHYDNGHGEWAPDFNVFIKENKSML